LKPMLVIIDMLVDFLEPWSKVARAPPVEGVRSLAEAFRMSGYPIAWVRQEFESDLSDAFREMRDKNIKITIKGTPGCKIIPELLPHPNDDQIIKKRYSAFFKTNLDQLILTNSIDTIVLAGINTRACVRATAIDAYQRDLSVIIPREAVGSYDRDHETVSLRYMDGKIASVLPLAVVASRIRESGLSS
jgi:nicotinamidase-related amidase